MTLHDLESLCPVEMERWGIVQVQSQNLGVLNSLLDQCVSLPSPAEEEDYAP